MIQKACLHASVNLFKLRSINLHELRCYECSVSTVVFSETLLGAVFTQTSFAHFFYTLQYGALEMLIFIEIWLYGYMEWCRHDGFLLAYSEISAALVTLTESLCIFPKDFWKIAKLRNVLTKLYETFCLSKSSLQMNTTFWSLNTIGRS